MRPSATTYTYYILCNDTRIPSDAISPWAPKDINQYWPGNDWDWRSQKFLGDYPNHYYDTFVDDALHGGADLLKLARDLLLTGSDFHSPFRYSPPAEPAAAVTEDGGAGRRRRPHHRGNDDDDAEPADDDDAGPAGPGARRPPSRPGARGPTGRPGAR